MHLGDLHDKIPFLRHMLQFASVATAPVIAAQGRLKYLSPLPRRFTGAYADYETALSVASRSALAGYDHDEIADVAFEQMCKVASWDYPVLFWLKSLLPHIDGLVDAGGHMGTKYRAFRPLLQLEGDLRWVVYDLPAIVRAGRKRAEKDGLGQLGFVDRIEDAGEIDLFLGSGLMQYLNMPLSVLLGKLPRLPTHVILNKVALRGDKQVVTLERIGKALVPYQMRDQKVFLNDIQSLGYRMVDRWSIPSLSHAIDTHPELGRSENAGFYFRLEN